MMAGIERMMGLARGRMQNAVLGQSSTCSAHARPASQQKLHLPAAEPWLAADRLHREFQVVGFYLSAHPLDEYKAALQKMRVQNWAEFSAAVKRGATAGRLAGTVTSKQERKTRTGNKMGVVHVLRPRPASTRRCCSPKRWRNIATCWSRAARW